jgi:uncharacterized membrane protein YdbT with pleckstrin-like domain
MKVKEHLPEIITILLAVFVVIISFTPVVIPKNIFNPQLMGLPYSLWVGILVTILLVFLTYIATRVHKEAQKARKIEKELKTRKK